MKDQKKTKEELISELVELRLQIEEFELMEAKQEQAEAELLKKNWNLLAILRASPLPIISADIEGRMVLWNPAAERIFGWSEQEVLGRPNPIIPKNKEEEFRNLHERALRQELLTDTEVCRQKKDGSLIDVSISRAPLYDTKGDIVGVIAIVMDITERKLAEEKVEEQLQFLQTLLDTIPSPVFYKNVEGRYTGCNKAFEDFVGMPAEEIIGKTVYDMGPKEIADKYYEKDRELFDKPGKQNYEWKVKASDGELKDVIFNKATIMDTNGDVEGLIGVISDITERKRAEKALRQRETELEIRANELEELNSALKVLLRKRDEDQSELEEKVLSTVKELVLPYVERLKRGGLDSKQMAYLSIVESNLDDIVSPFARKLSSKYLALTPMEISVANLIREGKITKEIAELLNVSTKTVEFHRQNIRKKIGIKHKKANLRSHLLSV